jgi:FkbM family methyltransferase
MADKLFSARRLPGKVLRTPLRLIPLGTTVRILMGPGRGLKWLAGSGPHSCWLGFNELRKRVVFASAVRPGDTVYDIGANVGFYSLMAARWVGRSGHVVAFEPVPSNLRWLRRHLEVNGVSNVRIEEVAVWHTNGRRRFMETADRVSSHVSERGQFTVRTATVDTLMASGRYPPPTHVKIDVEGAELQVLQGARDTLSTWSPTVFLATHGTPCESDCRDLLQSVGYAMQPIRGYEREFVARRRSHD